MSSPSAAPQPPKRVDLEEGVTLDDDASGQVIGIEVLDVRHRIDVEAMTTAAATVH